MKNILILLTVLLLPLTADGQDKPSFSAREMADVRVATPGLFAKSNHIYLHLDSLKDHVRGEKRCVSKFGRSENI